MRQFLDSFKHFLKYEENCTGGIRKIVKRPETRKRSLFYFLFFVFLIFLVLK